MYGTKWGRKIERKYENIIKEENGRVESNILSSFLEDLG